MNARFVAAALLLSSSAQASVLYTTSYTGDFAAIDLSTLRTQPRGPLGATYDWGGLAWDPTTNTMFMAAGRANPAIYTVDVGTGAATFVGNHNIPDVFSISVDPSNGFLYALQANSYYGLYRLNKSTGAGSLIGARTSPTAQSSPT